MWSTNTATKSTAELTANTTTVEATHATAESATITTAKPTTDSTTDTTSKSTTYATAYGTHTATNFETLRILLNIRTKSATYTRTNSTAQLGPNFASFQTPQPAAEPTTISAADATTYITQSFLPLSLVSDRLQHFRTISYNVM